MLILVGTAQVKDIKPGVLSKIMNITEKAPVVKAVDLNTKRLLPAAQGLEGALLEYANHKPVKKVFNTAGEGKVKESTEDPEKYRNFIQKVFEVK